MNASSQPGCPSSDLKLVCNCTYPCERHGRCCECLAYHRKAKELPACYFDADTEKTYDRTLGAYLRAQERR